MFPEARQFLLLLLLPYIVQYIKENNCLHKISVKLLCLYGKEVRGIVSDEAKRRRKQNFFTIQNDNAIHTVCIIRERTLYTGASMDVRRMLLSCAHSVQTELRESTAGCSGPQN